MTKRYVEEARIIQEQLGGKALYLIGAKNLMCGEIDGNSYLSFRIMRNPKKANFVRITLMPSDTYRVEIQRIGRAPSFKITELATYEDVYVDNLHDVIEAGTDLYLSLHPRG